MPQVVVCDVQTLKTLPARELTAGFAEVIKHGLIADKDYFQLAINKRPEQFSSQELVQIVTRSVEIKTQVVEKDTTEAGLRKILNFGHTVGHAIEAVSLESNFPLLHGQAVMWGMLIEAKISQTIGLLSAKEWKIIQKALQLVELQQVTVAQIMKKMQLDKKMDHGSLRWTLLKKIGQAVINQPVEKNIVEEALHEHLPA